MTEQYQPIAELLSRVRARWRGLVACQATIRAALAATGALSVVLLVARWLPPAPTALAALGVVGLACCVAAVVWAYRPIGHVPSDARIARFIEERKTELDERLVSAVHTAARGAPDQPTLAASMIHDAARAASLIDPREIVPSEALRRAGFQAAAAVLLFASVGFVFRQTVYESFDALSLAFFPSRVVLEVTPGNARVQSGSSLTVVARLVGNRAPVVARLLRVEGDADDGWRAADMHSDAAGRFTLSLDTLATSFRYRVVAGAVTSKTFTVAVVRAPRVSRIDVAYTYPKALGLPPRVEEDGGDIYAPAGTDVRIRVHTDLPAASGRMVLAGDKAVALDAGPNGVLTGSLQIVEDSSYRVALADAEGLSSRGDTEYFIRALEDRPPDVHVVKPASDRRVTMLEEVDIEAEAEDDFGIASLDLVYAVRGRAEKVVRLGIPQRATSATGRHTLYLEDLDVRPGDFVSYYVRARDLARGKRSSEARSDIFFLDVKSFEEEFTLAQSQAAMGGGQSNQELDDLVAAQKQIIVATWKLDRRAQAARGAQSAEDIKAVGRAESELKTRVEQASSAFRQSAMRDPRSRPTAGRGGQPSPGGAARAGQTLVEEDDMAAAATAMGTAVTALNALKTAAAVPPEMDALDRLLKAQADVKKRQVQQQQAAGGGGSNRSSQDLSSLFDKELARRQQTNYETPGSASDRQKNEDASALDEIQELARRQDELLKRQRELARAPEQMTPEEMKRELEKLTREQNDLRQQAEDVAQQMARQQQGQSGQAQRQRDGEQPPNGGQQPAGQQSQSGQAPAGQPSQSGQSGQSPSGQQSSQSAQAGGQTGKAMRDISEEMRGAASDLKRQDADQASARAARALDKLRDLERQLQSATPDGQRRALGDLELEARQLAEAERRIASESARAGQGEAGKDSLRRLAGEQERLADRARRVQDGLKRQGTTAAGSGKDAAESRNLQRAAGDAARELDRQRLADRMQQSAEAMRSAAGQPNQGETSSRDVPSPSAGGSAQSPDEIARALERLADKLAAATRPSDDDESRKLSDQLARTQELRNRLDDLSRQLDQIGRQDSDPRSGQSAQSSPQGTPGEGKAGQGQGGSGGASADVARLREELNREMKDIADLLNQLPREDAAKVARGDMGRTFEGQGMTLSSPGTEAFKQDFAKWQELKRQVTAALEQAELALTAKLQQRQAKDRLAAGADDTAPAEYQKQVDSYFKALAARKKP